jgi:hypothetical protein
LSAQINIIGQKANFAWLAKIIWDFILSAQMIVIGSN